jgi:hypothetical protein
VQGWELSGLKTKAVCQSCHMPAKGGKLVEWINYDVPTRKVASHAFPGVHDPDLLASALAVELEVAERQVVVRIRNTGSGHQIPASPWRKLIADVEALDAIGRIVFAKRDGYFHERSNEIWPDRPGVISFAQRAPFARVRVTLRYRFYLNQPDDEAAKVLVREFLL